MTIKHIVLSLLFLSLLFLAVKTLAGRTGTLFTQLFIGQTELTVELANTDERRALGLMYRKALSPDMGMLFVFLDSDYRSFWMKNTLIELDIIYIDSAKKVVHIEARVPPCKADPCPSYPSSQPARYVLELGGGEAERLGLKPGDRVDFILPADLTIE